ncbi:transposase [bacterium]|nr:transposase [bacterium]
MKRYKVYPEETEFYYTTSTIVNWIPIFQKNELFQIIIKSLIYCQKNKGLNLHGYVIMPTHLHLITSQNQKNILSEIMRDFKHFTSTEIIKYFEKENHVFYLKLFKQAASKRSIDQNHKIWKNEYHPIAIKSPQWFNEKLNYMHNNPVRKGFVKLPEHWKYSSARNWLYNDNSIIQIQKLDTAFTYGGRSPITMRPGLGNPGRSSYTKKPQRLEYMT